MTLRAIVPVRCPVKVQRLPPLARLLACGERRPHGVARVAARLVRAAFHIVHRRLGIAARAEIGVDFPAGPRMIAVDGANTSYLIFCQHDDGRLYEPELQALFELLAPELDVVFDVGANWGYYGLFFASHPAFRGRVHAFEADPRTAAEAATTMRRAGIAERVTVHPFGLSAKTGRLPFKRSRHSALGHIPRGAGGDRVGLQVEVRDLDSLPLEPPTLVKIDVEGHEDSVLAGGERTLSEHLPVVVLENRWSKGNRGEFAPPLERLWCLGYDIYRLEWEPTDDGRCALSAVPIPDLAARTAVPRDLNLLAWPARRRSELFVLFSAAAG